MSSKYDIFKTDFHLKSFEGLQLRHKLYKQYFLVTKKGMVMEGYGFDKQEIEKKYPIAELFFDGPKQTVLSLEDRKKILKHILNALDSKTTLSLTDAFPLFDGTKIEPKKWEIQKQDKYDCIEKGLLLSKNAVYTRYMEVAAAHGGTMVYPFEAIWARRKDYKPEKAFEAAYQHIYRALENSIIPVEEIQL